MEDKQAKLISALNDTLEIFKKHGLTSEDAVQVARAAHALAFQVIPYEYPQDEQADRQEAKSLAESVFAEFMASGRIRVCEEAISIRDVYAAYEAWHRENRKDEPLNKNLFAGMMDERFKQKRVGGILFYVGLSLL